MFLQCVALQCLEGLMVNLYIQFMGSLPSLQMYGLEALIYYLKCVRESAMHVLTSNTPKPSI